VSRPWLIAITALVVVACERTASADRADSTRTDTAAAPDSIPDERPDSVSVTPPDSVVMTLALLPPPPGTALGSIAAELGERAVFVPRTQRWFMARVVDGALSVDIGRIDGGVSNAAAFDQMLAARSPVQPGMTFTIHLRDGAATAPVTALRLSGRRILATLGPTSTETSAPTRGTATSSTATSSNATTSITTNLTTNADVGAVPVEWRGSPPAAVPSAATAGCPPGDTAAISAAIARYVPVATATRRDAVTAVRGCFGDFRALLTVRPLDITTESAERVVLVRANGSVRSGRLRDLSYPLHALVTVTDVDADGTHEIIVRSFRPAMETWAALRMTDSVTFTRFASGFTIEKR